MTPISWMHAFVDVPGEDVGKAHAFWSEVLGWPLGDPWPGHPEFASFVPTDGAPYAHVQRIDGPPRLHLDLVAAHSETIDWLTTVLAEEALGGPSALVPTPLQRVAGGVVQAFTFPTRIAVRGAKRAVNTAYLRGEQARETMEEFAGTVVKIGSGTREVASVGRKAMLQRAERVAEREGADATADALHGTRAELGALKAAELPIKHYEEMTAQESIAALRKLSDPDELNAMIRFEESHKNRSGVISAAHTRYAAVAKNSAGI